MYHTVKLVNNFEEEYCWSLVLPFLLSEEQYWQFFGGEETANKVKVVMW